MSKPVVSIVFDASTLSRIDRIADRMRRSRSSIVELLCLGVMIRRARSAVHLTASVPVGARSPNGRRGAFLVGPRGVATLSNVHA
jgi:hypothetical protein